MTIEKLKELANSIFELMRQELAQEKGCTMKIAMVKADGAEIYEISDPIANSGPMKDAVSRKLKSIVAKGDVLAVMTAAESWVGTIKQDIYDQCKGLSLSQLAERGLVEKQEALTLSMETPIFTYLIQQTFTRNDDGEPILGETETHESPNDGRASDARFSQWFPDPATTGQQTGEKVQ
jgi:hypothetical protein